MPAERPTPVLVIAILNLVRGGFGALATLGSGLITAAGARLAQALSQVHPVVVGSLQMPGPMLTWTEVGLGAVGFGIYAATVIVAVGLLRLRPWARRGGIAVACLDIAYQLVSLYFLFVVLNPYGEDYGRQLEQWHRSQAPQGMEVSVTVVTVSPTVGLALWFSLAAIWVAYDLVQIVVLRRPHVRAAFERPSWAQPG
jgi:hypothetical protein